eukprot:6170701-Amphidinium_carterae.1
MDSGLILLMVGVSCAVLGIAYRIGAMAAWLSCTDTLPCCISEVKQATKLAWADSGRQSSSWILQWSGPAAVLLFCCPSSATRGCNQRLWGSSRQHAVA